MTGHLAPKPPLQDRTWFSVALLTCAALAVLFGATGPISATWFARWPEIIRFATAFLSRFGLYLGLGLVAGLIYARRKTVSRWLSILGSTLRSLYGRFLSFTLAPVLDSRHALIVYGRKCVLRHFTTGKYLTSIAGRNYSHDGSSTQQVVFGTSIPDINSIWVVFQELDNPRQRSVGAVVSGDEIIRFQHEATGCYLHSHLNPAPSSSSPAPSTLPVDIQKEVCASTQNNPEDNWRVSCQGRFATGVKVRFIHTSSNNYLHSHDILMSVAGRSNCFEVTCCGHHNDDDFWILVDLDRTRILVA